LVCIFCSFSASANQVEILNLYDAFGHHHEGTEQDHGLSILVRYNGKTILFDSGTNSDILEMNSQALGVDLAEVDFAVASHAHLDHTGGFHYLLRVNPNVKIYYPNDTFGVSAPLNFDISGKDKSIVERLPLEQRYFQGKSTIARIETNGIHYKSVIYVKEHTQIIPGMNLIVTKSENIGYFTKYPGIDLHGHPTRDDGKAKFIGLPELSLSLSLPEGEILLVGCSHSTVEEIVMETKKQLNRDVYLLAGGYHLLPYEQKTIEGIADRLKNNLSVKNVAPAHCTGHLGFHVLTEKFGKYYRFFGQGNRIKL
jgi:7,8-dihydropterin-6-yl-methyl-4-(beta-D-ribofuranosyl)aminobenzene 5'-phosphate synthase